jgi:ADP-ribosylglycohydrolase
MEYIPEADKLAGITQEPWGLAVNEVETAAEAGRDVAQFRTRLADLKPTADKPTDDAALLELYEAVLALPAPAQWPHFESSDFDEILAQLPHDPDAASSVERLTDRVRGAWVGRVIGNTMGKPFEIGPTRESIRNYLVSIDAYPLSGFVPFADGADPSVLGRWGFEGVTAGRIDGAVRDDDIDYTVLGLHLLEEYGSGYTSRNVAYEWLLRLPVYQVFTAERATYQNLVREIDLDQVGEFHNPFREWIGALIRADIFGFVSPGQPRRAALQAFQDAHLSHRANGIYGEMWAAALIATAFTAASPEASVTESLRHIPPTSRLAEEIRTVLADWRAGGSWDDALDAIAARHPSMSWVHTINNAGALTAAILWGEGSFVHTVALAVQAGLDTDSIGASAGAWAGAFVGEAGVPTDLTGPLNDHYRSGVFGFGDSSISELAERTLRIIES